jgi:3-hydroxyethyl bacteriochlorophyllide a dehydrogenase
MFEALAVVLERPEQLSLQRLPLDPPGENDVVIETAWSGISAGTERLLFRGRMPPFPGMGYPLVPGYETVGTVVRAGAKTKLREGATVFVPGARCYGQVRGLFGGAASHLVSPASRVVPISRDLSEKGVLLALAATAFHACGSSEPDGEELIVGHGILGRLLARLRVAQGEAPVVWEHNPARRHGGLGYDVCAPIEDRQKDYRRIFDVSGDPGILDSLITRLAPGGEIVLAGFYESALSFAFPPAFMREARIRVAAEWREPDLVAVKRAIESGALSLDGLITHRRKAADVAAAYPIAFNDSECLKMVVDWRDKQ